MLEQGPTEKVILDQCYRQGLPLPLSIQNAPDLTRGLELYYRAFFDLSTCRSGIHGTEGPIQWTAIIQWATVYGLSEEQREDLVHHIGQMDEVYLKFKAKKMTAAAKRT